MRKALIVLAALALVGVTTRAAAERGDGVAAKRVPGAGAPGVSNDETEHVSRTVSLDSGGTLRLKNFSGRVTITASDGAEVVVDALRRASRYRLDRVTLDVHKDGDTVVVDANHRERSSWWWDNRGNNVVETDLDIKVPRRTNLDIDCFKAPVNVTGVEGAYKVHTFSSRVRLNNVIWQDNQTIDVETFSGNVELQLPASATGTVSFNSFSGDLKSDLPLVLRSSGRRSFKAELGNGTKGRVRVKTFSGDVRINR